VVMDNLTAHKGERVRELIEERSCELLYRPSYSPDLNPIEEAFSRIKAFIRKAEVRSREALIEAIGAAISSRLGMLAVSSSTAGTLRRFNRYDERCMDRIQGRNPLYVLCL